MFTVVSRCRSDVDGAEVGALDAGVLLGHDHGFPDLGRRSQDDVHGRIPLQVQFHPDAFIAHVAVLQGNLSAGDGQGIIAVGVRDGSGRGFRTGFLHQDAGPDQGLAPDSSTRTPAPIRVSPEVPSVMYPLTVAVPRGCPVAEKTARTAANRQILLLIRF